MLQIILNKTWRQNPTKQQVYGLLPPITKTIQVRRTRHAGHCWKIRRKLIRDILLWILSHGRAKAGRPVRTDVQQLCTDKGCSPEDLLEEMDEREGWQESVRVNSATWWWWWWWFRKVFIRMMNFSKVQQRRKKIIKNKKREGSKKGEAEKKRRDRDIYQSGGSRGYWQWLWFLFGTSESWLSRQERLQPSSSVSNFIKDLTNRNGISKWKKWKIVQKYGSVVKKICLSFCNNFFYNHFLFQYYSHVK